MHLVSNVIFNMLASVFGDGAALFVVNRLTFIGVMHHELSHALLAFVSGAKVHEISLFKPSGTELGHVKISYRGNVLLKALQSCLAAYAPVICGTMTSLVLIQILQKQDLQLWARILLLFLLISIILHEDLSKRDIMNGLKGLPIIMGAMFVIFLVSGLDIRADMIKLFSNIQKM